jgi:uncharacterized protein
VIEAIDVRDLVTQPGASRQHVVRAQLDDLGTELARLRDDVPLRADLLLEALVEGILVSGTVRGELVLRCARCLTEFDQPLSVAVHEMFVVEPDPEADDYPLDPDGMLELDQMVRDVVGVELPFSPLCRADCQGLCPTCGADRNQGGCPGHAEVDPRWAALGQLTSKFDEN